MKNLKHFENLCKYDNNFLIGICEKTTTMKEYYNKIIKINLNNNISKQKKEQMKEPIIKQINEYYNKIDKINFNDDISEQDDDIKQIKEQIKEYYNEINKINLNDNVSEQIKVGFKNALHLLIYSMYYRNFNTIAKEHALIVLEATLKDIYYNRIDIHLRNSKKKLFLYDLLTFFIIKKELINIDDVECSEISILQQRINEKEIIESIKENSFLGYEAKTDDTMTNLSDSEKKIKCICYERNQLAHNSEANNINGKEWVEVCAKIINKLYDSQSPQPLPIKACLKKRN